VFEALKGHALSLLEAENTLANTKVFQSSSHKFMSTIMTSGTLEDQVSALTLAVQESPLHNMKAFSNLLGLCKKKSRNHALLALGALKDLLCQGVVLPSDRKLRWFGSQPGLLNALQGCKSWNESQALPEGLQNTHLLLWAFEDWLKTAYFELIQVLESWCNDEIEYSRARSLTFVWELLKEKPEQEENLLRLLVNKLGDKAKKVASRASYLLLQLETAHPNMKETIVKAIESDILFRPGQNLHAKYYAVITLNQTVLSTKDQPLSRKLLDVYFALFRSMLKHKKSDQPDNLKAFKKGEKLNRKAMVRAKKQADVERVEEETSEKMLAQVLTGVNRAFPFAELDTATFDAHLDTLYKITHSSNFNTSVQALILIEMIIQSKNVTADRYYRTLYESLLDPRLMASSKQVMYLNLLYRSLKADLSIKRVQAFIKRILQILSLHEPPFICSALYLVNEIIKQFPSLATMLSEAEFKDEDEEERFVDVPEDGEDHENGDTNGISDNISKDQLYDAKKRDPLYANADRSCLWELLPFQAHFHPSVALFAQQLLLQGKMPPKPDPTLHTLMHFLDRFVYRNAKTKSAGMRGTSIMQPLANTNAADLLIQDRSGASTEAPLNTEAFWSKHVDDVAADEVFFHQYFTQLGKKKTKTPKKDKHRGADDSDAEDDDQEDEIWKALVDSRPEIEGDEDEEGFSDMEELMAEDDDDDDDDENSEGEDDVDMDDEVELNLDSDDKAADDSQDDELDIPALDSDEDAIIGSDEEMPADVGEQSENEASEDEEDKAKAKEKKSRRKKLKQLPIFASAEDYAHLLGNDDDEDMTSVDT
jgi:ribosome biogenesis protein MAK21